MIRIMDTNGKLKPKHMIKPMLKPTMRKLDKDEAEMVNCRWRNRENLNLEFEACNVCQKRFRCWTI